MSSAFQENRGSDKAVKISPRVTGNLTERNQIHETYSLPLLGHRKNREILITDIICSFLKKFAVIIIAHFGFTLNIMNISAECVLTD